MTRLTGYKKAGDFLVSHGRSPIFSPSSPFTIGTTRPTSENVGVGGAALRSVASAGLPTTSAGDIVIDDAYHAANATSGVLLIERVDLYGFVKVRTRLPVTIRRSRIRGSSAVTGATRTALVDCNHPNLGLAGAANVLLEECDLIPAFPSEGIDGVVGHDYTARRCLVRNTVDFFGAFNSYRPADPGRVTIEGCYGDSLAYFSPCSYQSDNRTHNDGIQIQGNSGYVIRGNDLRAQPSSTAGNGFNPTDPTAPAKNPYAPASVTGQVIGITPNVSSVTDVLIEKNWFSGGRASVIATPGSYSVSGVTMRDNRFDRTQPLITTAASGSERRAVILAPGVSFVGAPSSTGPDTQGNVYDDGAPVTIYREAA